MGQLQSAIYKNLNWAFVPNPTDQKHNSYTHPIFSCILSIVSTLYLNVKLSNYLEDKYPEIKQKLPKWSKKKALPLLVMYLILILSVRLKQNGPHVFYEMAWACNLALITVISALLRNSSLTVGSCLVIISIDQCLWYVDLLGYFLTGKFPIGVSQYITWPTTTKLRIITSTHHIWFIPLLICMLKKIQQRTGLYWGSGQQFGLEFSKFCNRLLQYIYISPIFQLKQKLKMQAKVKDKKKRKKLLTQTNLRKTYHHILFFKVKDKSNQNSKILKCQLQKLQNQSVKNGNNFLIKRKKNTQKKQKKQKNYIKQT
ncbi:hypothetical protein IMG5_047930 [Ichthyophthirius multifiliis]|uniref:Uncharacterized protein n=1 Tax=Ichthyophthirius multifiliis TaxID=5932 RepID=G0QME4_ICHMU|nr:hypothetical protein IMG5_047930 [Ichthyophthirius multifiliis]EGR33613.1 hypothetical protein IMG5_047930 [Ichthyophthirius multifiliis]|eukprot:XP_004037599.1 hypothetical protein IMG5_047930 [Ichthyophthirius multifiliis]